MFFEIALHPSDLKVHGHTILLEGQSTEGTEEIPKLPDSDDYGPTNRLIQRDQFFHVFLKFTVKGRLAKLLCDGTWRSRVVFEAMGMPEEPTIVTDSTIDLGIDGHTYTLHMQIPPNTLGSGVHRVVSELQYHLKDGTTMPIVAFDDKYLIRIYDDNF